MRPLTVLLAIGSLALPAFGCAKTGPINSRNPSAIATEFSNALNLRGLKCAPQEKAYLCDGGKSGSLNIAFEQAHAPERINMTAPFRLKTGLNCDAVLPALHSYNVEADMSVATCRDNPSGAIVLFETFLLIPASGFDANEMGEFVVWWSKSVIDTLKRSRVIEILDDGSPTGPAAPPPMEGGGSGATGSGWRT